MAEDRPQHPPHHNFLGPHTEELIGAYVMRVERLEREIAERNDDKSEVYKEAKAIGLDARVLRKVVARRRKARDEVVEEDTMLELYEDALNRHLARYDPLDN